VTEPVQLPNAIITGFAVNKTYAVGTEGERHAIVALTLQLAISEGNIVQQTFIMHKDDVPLLRSELKNPPTIDTNQESLPIEEQQ